MENYQPNKKEDVEKPNYSIAGMIIGAMFGGLIGTGVGYILGDINRDKSDIIAYVQLSSAITSFGGMIIGAIVGPKINSENLEDKVDDI
ncbi:MAG: hypothetical protein QW727_01515 [Candidatus Pacearchaeota archaeon]